MIWLSIRLLLLAFLVWLLVSLFGLVGLIAGIIVALGLGAGMISGSQRELAKKP